jgi:hypothetical protein
MIPPGFPDHPSVRRVGSFAELAGARFEHGVNALCWPRRLPGDFGEVVRHLPQVDGILTLESALLESLPLSAAGRVAVAAMRDDLEMLRGIGREPELNCIAAYPRDEADAVVRTDVYSFHADSAPVESDTWLCTYHGAASEALLPGQSRPRVQDPATRAVLLAEFGGADDEDFAEYLRDCCYDLHHAPLPGARAYGFGIGHLWRIAVEWPGAAVPPCIHRAPENRPGDPPRLLMIS